MVSFFSAILKLKKEITPQWVIRLNIASPVSLLDDVSKWFWLNGKQ